MLASTSAMRISPIEDDSEMRPDINIDHLLLSTQDVEGEGEIELEQNGEGEEEDQAQYIKFLMKQVAINRRYQKFYEMFTYDYVKSTTKWLLEVATCDISLKVNF